VLVLAARVLSLRRNPEPAQPQNKTPFFEDEELEGRGSLAEIRGRFDSTVDGSTEVLGRLDELERELASRETKEPVSAAR